VHPVILVQGLVLLPGVGIAPGREYHLFLRVMRGVHRRNCFRVVIVEFGMTALVRAGRDGFMGIMIVLLVAMRCWLRFASW